LPNLISTKRCWTWGTHAPSLVTPVVDMYEAAYWVTRAHVQISALHIVSFPTRACQASWVQQRKKVAILAWQANKWPEMSLRLRGAMSGGRRVRLAAGLGNPYQRKVRKVSRDGVSTWWGLSAGGEIWGDCGRSALGWGGVLKWD
jgi:hypothetical protein